MEFDPDGITAFGADQVAALRALARPVDGDFTYAYRRIIERSGPIGAAQRGTTLAEFADFMCSEMVVDLFRRVTGNAAVDFADAKASRYDPGDFLSLHHDRVEGSDRIAAYVLSLNKAWRPEHGGLLMFHEGIGDVLRAWVPQMNALALFAVPQAHSVSQVTSFASEPRFSVTGWLRSSPARVFVTG
jgi:Rps23 Pro-64 3,4-dihydroxylase Tpa1-like proline 4-hydroxylase